MTHVFPWRRTHAGRDEITLRDCPRQADVVIDGIDLDRRHRFRLLELGLRPGVRLRIVQRGGFGGRVVARGSERIALDGGTAGAIRVHRAPDAIPDTTHDTIHDTIDAMTSGKEMPR